MFNYYLLLVFYDVQRTDKKPEWLHFDFQNTFLGLMNKNLKYVKTCYKDRGYFENLDFNFIFIQLFVYLKSESYGEYIKTFVICMGVIFFSLALFVLILFGKWGKQVDALNRCFPANRFVSHYFEYHPVACQASDSYSGVWRHVTGCRVPARRHWFPLLRPCKASG